MQNNVVCNASPLIFLAKIGMLETLLFELLEKGYRIKEELFLEFIKKIRD